MFTDDVNSLSLRKKCVFYNDLGHMNPIYLSKSINDIHIQDELIYHKRNIYLLALQFEHILICTDNIMSFSNFKQAEIIKRVVTSDWFSKLFMNGVIVLCGMGANRSRDLMKNLIDYATIWMPETKDRKYIDYCISLAQNGIVIPREYIDGEDDFADFLVPNIKINVSNNNELASTMIDAAMNVNSKNGFIGTMDIYPEIKLLGHGEDEFYKIFFNTFSEYTEKTYTNTFTVNTSRMSIPGAILKNNDSALNLSTSLLSPDFFQSYLDIRLGKKLSSRVIGIDPEKLIWIRNGDWKVFLQEYHACIEDISQDAYVYAKSIGSTFLKDSDAISHIISNKMKIMMDSDYDIDNYISILSAAAAHKFGAIPLLPVLKIFNSTKNYAIRSVSDFFTNRGCETRSFLSKLSCALDGKHLIMSI